MQNLDSLIAAVRLNGARGAQAIRKLYELAREEENRPVLIAHPGLLPLVIERFSSSADTQGCDQALRLIYCLTEVEPLRRHLYLYPGLVEALIRGCELNASRDLGRYAACAIAQLVENYENKWDFIRLGHAERLVSVVTTTGGDEILHETIWAMLAEYTFEEEEEDEDAPDGGWDREEMRALRFELMGELYRVPGFTQALVRSKHTRFSFRMIDAFAEDTAIALELLDVPGLVDLLVSKIVMGGDQHHEDVVTAAFTTMSQLVYFCAVRALDFPQLRSTLLNAASGEFGDYSQGIGQDCLVVWRMNLARHVDPDTSVVDARDEAALVCYWRNLPGMWVVLSPRRVKQRSPLRRLPVEMFRLLHVMMCGKGGIKKKSV